MANLEIPDKLFFRIGEVCKLLDLPPYVLRFWETEFPTLAPTKGANGRRMYRRRDVEMAVAIKDLLYEQGFTIAGARKLLTGSPHKDPSLELSSPRVPVEKATKSPPPPENGLSSETLNQIKTELRNILTILNRRC
jgi:DNA-binding transcriptional MerR regulator